LREPGKAIVYCMSRPECAKVAEKLRAGLGNEVAFYHAGVPSAERADVERFFREGAIRVVVATSAFGEGIDLPDVRNVFLYHLNYDVTEFNQQSGRAGRDGERAQIHVLFGERDRRINDYIIDSTSPPLHTLRVIYREMKRLAREGDLHMNNLEIAEALGIDKVTKDTIAAAVRIFADAGLADVGQDDDGRFVHFHEVTEKIDLTRTERFAEGQAERESFERFCALALTAKADVLTRVIDRPIYPANTPLSR
jgi:single-stranded-DNA-specific exonuclease